MRFLSSKFKDYFKGILEIGKLLFVIDFFEAIAQDFNFLLGALKSLTTLLVELDSFLEFLETVIQADLSRLKLSDNLLELLERVFEAS